LFLFPTQIFKYWFQMAALFLKPSLDFCRRKGLGSSNCLMRQFSTERVGPLTPSAREAFAKKHITPGIGRLTNLEIVSGKGTYVVDSNGRSFLDFTSGIAVTNLGHTHPKLVRAAKDQFDKIVHSQVNIYWHKPMLDLIEKMLTIVPKELEGFFFWNGGSDAVEAAIKVARYYTKKQNLIVFDGGYHGRTYGTMPLTTSKSIYRDGFGPFMPGIHVAPYPSCVTCRIPHKTNECCNDSIERLELMLKRQTTPAETAAILIEPILGEGGYMVPPKNFLPAIRQLCDKHNILMIVDEVQTGMGRTGKWWAVEHENVVPDILVFAKGIANGLPLSGIVSKWKFMEKQPPGSMGGTYAGNAVACAVACAVIDAIKEEKILENVNARGQELMKGLTELKQAYPKLVFDVRGRGLMVAVEFHRNLTGVASEVVNNCLEHGMILLTSGGFETIRFMPPLNVTKEEIQKCLAIFKTGLEISSKKAK
jgi:4-aminobutyrate aminotransferase